MTDGVPTMAGGRISVPHPPPLESITKDSDAIVTILSCVPDPTKSGNNHEAAVLVMCGMGYFAGMVEYHDEHAPLVHHVYRLKKLEGANKNPIAEKII